ncbi:glycosyltransferase family 8 protein [Gallibacterium genomosp. 3]|uniref:glycosyltransferase family 8 protein n=1 Tax=Gallibacterium genomosp. 3 TaxID=505345 RepID=UPI0008027170|nr:glycosyltransferase family 8 protein [Gallibacterium genomosp. 3]
MYDDNLFPIVIACDDNYIQYASVLISSIIKNRNKKYFYEINILSETISEENKNYIFKQANNYENITIKFISLDKLNTEEFYLNSYMTISTYYRFFIPIIFNNYDRILYLDCDIIVDSDISYLMKVDLDEYLLAACRDEYICNFLEKNKENIDSLNSVFSFYYVKNILKVTNPLSYFNAGVLLFNLKEFREKKLEYACFDLLKEIHRPYFQDQDILNSLASRYINSVDKIRKNQVSGVKLISYKYNVNIPYYIGHNKLNRMIFIIKFILYRFKKEKLYYIYHYISKDKPWKVKRFDEIAFYYYLFNKNTPDEFKKSVLKENNRAIIYYIVFKCLFLL